MPHESPDVLIRGLPGFDGVRFHPVRFLKLVNQLIDRGSDETWRFLDRYAIDSSQNPELRPENALLVARGACEVTMPDQPWPRLQLGTPDLQEPADPKQFPAWPLHVERGLPLMLVSGYVFGGEAMPVTVQLASYKRHTRVRTEKVVPEANSFVLVDHFLSSDAWRQLGPTPSQDDILQMQAWRAVDNVVSLPPDDERMTQTRALASSRWREAREKAGGMNLRWDVESNEYRSGTPRHP